MSLHLMLQLCFFISFLFSFSYDEWLSIKNEIVSLDFSHLNSFRCTFLPDEVFCLDEKCTTHDIARQAELLHDEERIEHTLSRGKLLSLVETRDLPCEMQHFIWDKLTDTTRAIIQRYWP